MRNNTQKMFMRRMDFLAKVPTDRFLLYWCHFYMDGGGGSIGYTLGDFTVKSIKKHTCLLQVFNLGDFENKKTREHMHLNPKHKKKNQILHDLNSSFSSTSLIVVAIFDN